MTALEPAPTEIHRLGTQMDSISDAIDDVNVLKDTLRIRSQARAQAGYDAASAFDKSKDKDGFRRYDEACERVKMFYAEQHAKQTLAFNIKVRAEVNATVRARMTVWEAMELLDTLIDDSDPDTSLTQIDHLLQTAESIRRDGKPDWMQLTGLVHDLGKLLCFYGAQGQWDVVGDTFVVGCGFDGRCIYPETFAANPDSHDPKLQTPCGIYEPNCGLDNVMLSWGHDEYLYGVMRRQSRLPKEALSMIRYHSFYPWHKEGAYAHLMDESDHEQLKAVRAFNPYDLYSKSDDQPSASELKPYYMGLIEKYIPGVIEW